MEENSNSKTLLEDLLSLHEASLECGLSHGHLAYLVRRGELRGWKIGRSWVTTREAIQEYLNLNKRPGPKKSS